MTIWIFSELGCTGNCQQGRLPCDCKDTAPEKEPEIKIEANISSDEKKVEVTAKWEF
jgi:hypothetical protein